MSAAILASAALSALGRGPSAYFTGSVGDVARAAPRQDDELARAKLARPFAARIPDLPDGERATALLLTTFEDLALALDRRDPAWRTRRVGLALASSSGGMREAEGLFRALRAGEAPRRPEAATYFAPLTRLPGRFSPATLVLTACSASTLAMGIGLAWLARDACDVVITGGFDVVSVFVASGFEALRATTARLPSRPFCLERDGMALGEGAALLALIRSDHPLAGDPLGWVTGFGASGDAVHITAPDRTGAGLARAARGALRGIPVEQVGLVSAHGTATPFNDIAEWKAIEQALGSHATKVVVHPFKAQVGHTLGAAGALESLAALDALRRGVLPASVLAAPRDPEIPARMLACGEATSASVALKLSAAFGGANAALAVSTRPPVQVPNGGRPVFVSEACAVDRVPSLAEVAAVTGASLERLARADELVLLALRAVARLRERFSLAGAGVAVGHAYATVDVNDRYFQRVLERDDARAAEPRRFPYTSPNAVAGECSVAFGLTGPNLAVSSGLHGAVEALTVAVDLVRARYADAMVVVGVDAPRRAAHEIARAMHWPLPPDGAAAVLVSSEGVGQEVRHVESATAGASGPLTVGHLALTGALASASPWGAFASLKT